MRELALQAADHMETTVAAQMSSPHAEKAHQAKSNSILMPKPQPSVALLSKIPGELRNRVWRLAVVEDAVIPIHVAHYKDTDGEKYCCIQVQHPLMHASKQTRHEVTDIYYLENTFRVTEDLLKGHAMEFFVKTLKPWAEYITRLEVSHELDCHAECETRKMSAATSVNLTVRRVNGRISLGLPPKGDITVAIERLGNEQATESRGVIPQGLCCCKLATLVNEHASHNVLNWVQKYVELVNKSSQAGACGFVHMAYCWNCTGLTMFGRV